MSEDYAPIRYVCARCSSPMSNCRCEHPAPVRALLAAYVELRSECMALEALIATASFTEKETTRLDKGVTVMKVGFKLVKKVLRERGLMGRLKPSEVTSGLEPKRADQMNKDSA